MVSIFTGAGTGFERGSGNVLGGAGLLGAGAMGRAGEQVMLNAATGNLLISRQDEYLVGRGPDAAISRTYNSLGDLSDDNGDNWRQSTQRQVRDLTGSVNSWGSTVKRVSGDGSVITYTFDGSGYVATDGAGAYDRITYDGTWRWTDGDSGMVEVYGGPNNQISELRDSNGNALTYSYSGDTLSDVWTANGERIHYGWAGSNLAEINTVYNDNGTWRQLTRVRYEYDGYGRLANAIVDLSPEDNGTGDGNRYITSYMYHGASKLVAAITQTDGSRLDIGYDGNNRVTSLTQTIEDGQSRTTTIGYGGDYTNVTDAQGQTTTLWYDGAGQLTQIATPPPANGMAQQVMTFAYDGAGNLTSTSDATGTTRFQYDGRGNAVRTEDANGNVTTRIYDGRNLLLNETITGSDADGAAAQHTTRYAYNGAGNLRYVVDAEGGVTEYAYDAAGLNTAIGRFANVRYDTTGWQADWTLPLDAIDAWQRQVDKSSVHVTHTPLDARGNVMQEIVYGATGSDGSWQTGNGYTHRYFTRDQAGQVLGRVEAGKNWETFVYDGLGRMVASTDAAGATTRIAFQDASHRTVVTLASGFVTTSTYSRAGELVAKTEGGAYHNGGTATYRYDSLGRLRSETDASGVSTWYVYDRAGRKVADVRRDGWLTEYRYDAADRLVATVRYTNTMAGYQFDAAADPNQSPQIADLRPPQHGQDIWLWTVYDAGGRVLQTIGGDGGTTTFEYDGSDRLVRTTAYANTLEGWRVDGFKGSAPTTVQAPSASGSDSVERRFYDRAGRLIGTLDGEGRLSRAGWDQIGEKVEEAHYGNLVPDHLRANGSFAQLLASVGSHPNDAVQRWVYDNQGHLRYEIDALGRVTEYGYEYEGWKWSAFGPLRQTILYAGSIGGLGSYTVDSVRQAIGNAGLAGNGGNRISRGVYDAAGRLIYAIDPEGAVTGYRYDVMGRVVRQVEYAGRRTADGLPDEGQMVAWDAATIGNAANRITRNYYTAAGQLRFVVDAEGYVTRNDYDAEGRLTFTVRWNDRVAATDGWSIDTVAANAGGEWAGTTYAYNVQGRLSRTTDGAGNVREYYYWANGALCWEIAAPGTADESRTLHYQNAAGRDVTRYDATWTADQVGTSFAYDGRGNLISTTDAAGRVTRRAYDRAGQLISVTDALGGVTRYTYDALGNRISETDARGSTTWSYYDKAGRVVAVRDAENYVTETSYTVFGEIASVTRRANQSYTAAGPDWPSVGGHPNDATTRFAYDKLGRATITWDAEGYVEQRWYDAFGNVVQEQNKAGGVTRRVFDRRGLLVAETAPAGSIDADGNVLARGTSIATFDPAYYRAAYADMAGADDATLRYHWEHHGWRERRNPNAFFNTNYYLNTYSDVAAAGINPLDHYRDAGIREGRRPIAGESPSDPALTGGVVTRFDYDARGNLTRKVEASGLPEQRTTSYAYDKADRLVETRGDAVQWVEQGGYTVGGTTQPVERRRYDTRGNVIELVDARGARTLSWYDKLDRKVVEIDAAGTRRSWSYDAVGNVTATRVWGTIVGQPGEPGGTPPGAPGGEVRETRYGYDALNRVTTSTVAGVRIGYYTGSSYYQAVTDVTTSYDYDAAGNVLRVIDGAGNAVHTTYDRLGRRVRQVDGEGYITGWVYDAEGNVSHERRWATRSPGYGVGWSSDPGVSGDDRVTDFTHDRMGRRLTETRRGVLTATVDGNGGLNQVWTDATVSYAYNGLGQVTRRSEATNEATWYGYDAAGRLTAETRTGYYDQDGVWTEPLVLYRYNGLGDVTRTEQTRQGGGETRVVRFGYSAGGRLHTRTDAAGTVFTYWQDIAGAEVLQTWNRNRSDGSVQHEGVLYTRDVLGRVDSQATGWYDGQWHKGDAQQTRYNAYGEVSQRGINGLQEDFAYDAAGNLARTNSGDGVWRYFLSDGAGRRTLTLENQSRGDMVAVSVDQALGIASNGSQTSIDQAYVGGLVATIATYDRRGQQVATRLPNRELSAGNVQSLGVSMGYTAFGELAWLRDAQGATTWNWYNTAGRRTYTQYEPVSVTDEAGESRVIATGGRFYYDVGGRLIGQDDANGHRTTRHLLGGTGYGSSEALVSAEFHADGGVVRSAYDRFGDKRRVTDAIGRTTTMSYDALGRLTQQIRPSGQWDSYGYDVLGQRLWHANSYLGADERETSDYDHQGRVVSTRAFGGEVTTTSYTWRGDFITGGMGLFGGWQQLTRYAGGAETIEESDVFGRALNSYDHKPGVSWYATSFSYDLAGRMASRSTNEGERITYNWYNTGLPASQSSDLGSGYERAVSRYGYDAAGRKTSESFWRDGTQYTQATAAYDALGRMTSWSQADTALPWATMTWAYDAVGNIRHTSTSRATLNSAGSAAWRSNEDRWFRYDAMNRVVLDGGQLSNGQIVRSWSGASLAYDAAGQRVSATRDVTLSGQVYVYDPYAGGPRGGYYDYDQGDWVYRDMPYQGERRESYGYAADGQLTSVSIAETGYYDDGDGNAVSTGELDQPGGSAEFQYDGMGRQIRQIDRRASGQVAYDHEQGWTAAGRVNHDVVRRLENGATLTADTWNDYGGGAANGQVVSATTYSYRDGSYQGATSISNAYIWRGGAAQIAWTQTSGQTSSSTSYYYNAGGRLESISISDGRSRSVSVVSDLAGQVLSRDEADGDWNQGDPHERWYRFNGNELGHVGNDAMWASDYASSIQSRGWVTQNGPFGNNRRYTNDFSPSIDRITSYEQGSGGGSYTVRAGDTLAGIASQVWGDASLWYMLAGANGLTANAALIPGSTLTLPAGVTRSTYNAAQLRPYDPTDAIGDVSPVAATPTARGRNKCGAFGKILLVAVAIAVTALVAPPLIGHAAATTMTTTAAGMTVATTTAATGLTATFGSVGGAIFGGALAGAAGSIASQGVGLATGIQDQFDWRGVALAGLSSAVAGGLGASGVLSGGKGMAAALNGAGRGALGNIATQGIAVATGLQGKFDWAGVAVGAAMGAGTGAIRAPSLGRIGERALSGMAGALAGAATRSLVTGTSFGDNVLATLPDVIGQTIGSLAAEGVAQSGQQRAARRAGVNRSADAFADQFGDTDEVEAYRKAGLAAAKNPGSDEARANFNRAARVLLDANSSDPGVAEFLAHLNPNSTIAELGDVTVTGRRGYLFGSTIDNAGIWVGETGNQIKQSVGQFVADHPGVGVALTLADAAFAVVAPGKYLLGKGLDFFKDEVSDSIANKMTGPKLWSVEKGQAGGSGFVLAGSLALGGLSALKGGLAAESAGLRGLRSSPYATNGDLVQSIAIRADNWGIRNGLGNGPAVGRAKHGYAEHVLNRYQRMFGDRGLTAEARYVGGSPWMSGTSTSGSIRLDVVEGPLARPTGVWDYKFGNAALSQGRITQIQNGIPNGTNVPILMVKP